MSRKYGRFTGNGSEAFQRQMIAPVHKWKKAWVSPTGLQPESSYKICKWVRVDMNAEDGTPAPEEDDEMEEGEEGDQGEEGDGEAEDVVGEEGVAEIKEDESTITAPGAGAVASTTEAAVSTTVAGVPVEAVSAGMEVDATGGVGDVPDSTPSVPVVDPNTTITSTTDQSVPSPTEPFSGIPTSEVTTEEPTIPITHPLPSNAIEISNTAPHTTEAGSGDLAGVGGVEITHGETQGMDVDEPSAATTVGEEGGEKGEALEMDDGLVMGDSEPVREEFVVQGEDKPREVDL